MKLLFFIKTADRLLLALSVVHAGWIGFAIAGVSVIVLASMLDRYGAIIKLKLMAK